MLSPRQVFAGNIRPAELFLKAYRLLEHDKPATGEEGLMVIYNAIFLGLIRERGHVPPASLRRSALCNRLRQAVTAPCTVLETYLPVLLRTQLSKVIEGKGREFVPKDKEVTEQFKILTFNLTEAARLLADPDPLFIANKMISFVNFSYLNAKRGIHVTGSLLGLEQPWAQIVNGLSRNGEEIQKNVHDSVNRRNNTVHRADRDRKQSDGPMQKIGFAWVK